MTLGEKLKDLRTEKGLSLDELANEFNQFVWFLSAVVVII